MATEYFNDAWRIPNNKNQSLVSNYSMEFDNVSNVNLGNAFEGTNEGFTISFWYNTSINQSNHIISKTSNNFEIYSFTDLTLYTYFGSKSKNTNRIPVVLNSWQHICYVVTSTEYKGYQNGVLTVTNAFTQTPVYTNNTSDIFLSSRAGGISSWSGKLDQTCFFDYALPATGTNSVATLYGGGTAVTNPMALSPKPVAYYQLGDQSVDNGANYLVPNNSLQDYVFNIQPSQKINTTLTPPTGANNRTISVWFKTGVNAFENICGYGTAATSQGFDICTHGSPSVYSIGVHAYGPAIIANGVYTPNQWNHYAITYDGTILRGYLNGQPVNTSTIALNTGTSVDFTIGGGAYTPANGFSGDVSNIAIWDSVLTASNVSTIYNNGVPNDISSLSPNNWYKLNAQDTFDGTDWTIKDYAGSNDGTSSGMTSANLVQSNLQHTSGFSPYAITLDGINDYINITAYTITSSATVSAWFNTNSPTNAGPILARSSGTGGNYYGYIDNSGGKIRVLVRDNANSFSLKVTNVDYNVNTWYHLAITQTNGGGIVYINGQYNGAIGARVPELNQIGNYQGTTYFNGKLSNIAIWNTNLSAAEITEIYNQGVPSNLNTFSGTAPVAWWQLGSNSSFNPNPTGTEGTWTCLDEIGTNNGVSDNSMTNDAITNGVGYSANGLGTSSIEIIGDAPYSTANGISENMDVLDRTTDVPS